MFYWIIGFALAGGLTLALSRQRVAPEPVCPNCRKPLSGFDVDRCPHCLLWQPPDRDVAKPRWRVGRALTGVALLILPLFAYLLVPLVLDRTFAPGPTQPTTRPPTIVPFPAGGLTPAQRARVRALGYIPTVGPPGGPGAATQPASPTVLRNLTPRQVAAVRAMRDRARSAKQEAMDELEASGEEVDLPPELVERLRDLGYLPGEADPIEEDGGTDGNPT